MKADTDGFRKIIVLAFLLVWGGSSFAQTYISKGRVVYERKTNLEKRFEGVDNPWLKRVDLKEPKIDKFELLFNDSSSLFLPIVDNTQMQNMREFLTMKNTSYQNLNQGIRKQKFNFFGTEVLLKDSLKERTWHMTNSTREIAGYNCRQARWDVNDSLRIYAWYAEELIPPVGPETFNGLPGVILGLATEDGGVVYFAKKVEVSYSGSMEKKAPSGKPKDFYTQESLTTMIKERFSNNEGGGMGSDGFIMDLFMW